MAKQMSITDDRGAIYANSYWVGACAWHEIPIRPTMLLKAIDEVLPILEAEDVTESRPGHVLVPPPRL